ncbi:autophagy-related protein 13b-like isoform X1 [Typha latifolia]|uniref:autophagy-related protein 13b-like isoform X1 n=1 Tax=Typha latifolia TaxID=4733 RepID=UPI003C2AD491
MASSRSSSHLEPPIVQQIITEFFVKSLHIILQSRSPHFSSHDHSLNHYSSSPSSPCVPSRSRPQDKRFNLALPDCPAALEHFDIWRQSNFEPLIIDIILMHRTLVPDKEQLLPGGCLARNLSGNDQYRNSSAEFDDLHRSEGERIVERWTVEYESRESSSSTGREAYSVSMRTGSCSSHSLEIPNFHKSIYKRSVVLLRTLYSFVRLLPAYRLFWKLCFSGRIYPLSLSYRISSFAEPFTRAEDAKMNHFAFLPIDTPCGRLNISVSYLPTLGDVSLVPSTDLSTDFIFDYVGSPTTQPLKRFQSLPSAELPPAHISVIRRCSLNNAPVSSSVSPTYYDSHPLHPHLPLCSRMHDNSLPGCSLPNNATALHKKNTTFDEYRPSPPFAQQSLPNTLLHTRDAPVTILSSRPGGSSILTPSPPKSTKHSFPSQDDNPSIQVMITSPDKKEFFKLGMLQTGMALQKLVYLWKDNVGHFTGLRGISQRIIFRTPRRLPPSDEFDDSGVVYPFAEDDRDVIDACNRIKISEVKDQEGENLEARSSLAVRSPESAIGALVIMLSTAPPLRQDFSRRSSQALGEETQFQRTKENKDQEVRMEKFDKPVSSLEIKAAGLLKSWTASDAIEVLRKYKEMRDLLVRQGGSQSVIIKSEEPEEKSAGGDPSQTNDD